MEILVVLAVLIALVVLLVASHNPRASRPHARDRVQEEMDQ